LLTSFVLSKKTKLRKKLCMMFCIYYTKNNNLADLLSISKTNICHIPESCFCFFAYSNSGKPVENFPNEKMLHALLLMYKSVRVCIIIHWLNMELDLQSLFGLHVHSCTHLLRLRNCPPPSHPIWAQDRRHLFVTLNVHTI
jgi:hypothetical protein